MGILKAKNPGPTTQERIAKYLDAIPPAVAGAHGHNQTFSVACSLYNGWNLSEEDTLAWLKVYNERCEPKWSEKELAHKAASAAKAEHKKPRGHFLNPLIEEQRTESDWTLPNKPIASGKIMDFPAQVTENEGILKSTMLTTLNSDLRACTHVCARAPAHAWDSGINVVNIVKSVASPTVTPLDPENNVVNVVKSDEQLTPGQLAEAQRIAQELAKLHKAGALKCAGDAQFYAHLLHRFGGEFIVSKITQPSRASETRIL